MQVLSMRELFLWVLKYLQTKYDVVHYVFSTWREREDKSYIARKHNTLLSSIWIGRLTKQFGIHSLKSSVMLLYDTYLYHTCVGSQVPFIYLYYLELS